MGTEHAETKTQHLQHPSTLPVHMEESWETSPQSSTFTPHTNPACLDRGPGCKVQAGLRFCNSPDLAMVWPRKMRELRHIKRQQELGNGQKDP